VPFIDLHLQGDSIISKSTKGDTVIDLTPDQLSEISKYAEAIDLKRPYIMDEELSYGPKYARQAIRYVDYVIYRLMIDGHVAMFVNRFMSPMLPFPEDCKRVIDEMLALSGNSFIKERYYTDGPEESIARDINDSVSVVERKPTHDVRLLFKPIRYYNGDPTAMTEEEKCLVSITISGDTLTVYNSAIDLTAPSKKDRSEYLMQEPLTIDVGGQRVTNSSLACANTVTRVLNKDELAKLKASMSKLEGTYPFVHLAKVPNNYDYRCYLYDNDILRMYSQDFDYRNITDEVMDAYITIMILAGLRK
jgi:hypothetical protein